MIGAHLLNLNQVDARILPLMSLFCWWQDENVTTVPDAVLGKLPWAILSSRLPWQYGSNSLRRRLLFLQISRSGQDCASTHYFRLPLHNESFRSSCPYFLLCCRKRYRYRQLHRSGLIVWIAPRCAFLHSFAYTRFHQCTGRWQPAAIQRRRR